MVFGCAAWEHPREDVVSRKREKKRFQVHRDRLCGVRSVVDCGAPASSNIRHLKERRRFRQRAEEQQHRIALENRLLMDRMRQIQNGVPTKSGGSIGDTGSISRPSQSTMSVLTRDKVSLRESVRRRQKEDIAAQNRMNARRLRELQPYYDMNKMLTDYDQQRRYQSSLSKAHQLQLRLQSQVCPKGTLLISNKNENETIGTSFSTLTQDSTTSGLRLRTAKQIRKDVAIERNSDLPQIFNSSFSLFNERLRLCSASSIDPASNKKY